ncbi:MAG: hypothetical protein A2Y24_03400 [Clostridiales bacterium GWE2_32_10]|nr:MAG: hypothetical protein A2Y24_03400 [Clostridiales bacterium GWE2_32_10]
MAITIKKIVEDVCKKMTEVKENKGNLCETIQSDSAFCVDYAKAKAGLDLETLGANTGVTPEEKSVICSIDEHLYGSNGNTGCEKCSATIASEWDKYETKIFDKMFEQE